MSSPRTTTSRTRPPAASAVGWLALVGVAGAIFMAVAHLDLAVLLSLAMAGGAALYAVVAYGAFAQRSWAWPAALVVNGVALAVTTMPFRGGFAIVPVVVSLVAIAVLVSPPGRAAMLDGD